MAWKQGSKARGHGSALRANGKPRRGAAARWLPVAVIACLGGTGTAAAEGRLPPIWGYGVQTCAAFASAAEGRARGEELQARDYRRYEDWLTGFVTGLNLATGQDVLVGADIDGAMERILAHCRGHQEQDFFTAAMDLVRMLSGLR